MGMWCYRWRGAVAEGVLGCEACEVVAVEAESTDLGRWRYGPDSPARVTSSKVSRVLLSQQLKAKIVNDGSIIGRVIEVRRGVL